VVAQALETAALMLGADKSRGHSLEMICADFLVGANLEYGNPEILLQSIMRFFKFLPGHLPWMRTRPIGQAVRKWGAGPCSTQIRVVHVRRTA
jgi:hypothetical protein